MDEFAISSRADYTEVVKHLYGKYTESGSLIVLRGQTSEHRLPDGRLALIPSGLRSERPAVEPEGLEEAVARYLELYSKAADDSTRGMFREKFGSRFETFIEQFDAPHPGSPVFHASELTALPAVSAVYQDEKFRAAVAQHYGLPTGLLDVTTDPEVALWFAAHKYTRGPRDVVEYESARDTSYVYAFQVAAVPEQVIALSTLFFDSATRPRRQQAALLSGAYYVPPDQLLERMRQVIAAAAIPQRPTGNSYADLVIARIVVERALRWSAADRPVEYLFPCPRDDRLYARLLDRCDWVETFAHCNGSRRRRRHRADVATGSTRPVESRRELARDPSWFTVLFIGDDAHAALAYTSRYVYAGGPLGRVNLFDRVGLNLLVATTEEAKTLIVEAGVAAVLFCDVDNSLVRSGTVDTVCGTIAERRRAVVPAYINLRLADRRFSDRPFDLLPENADSEAHKITSSIRAALELSWQLERADPKAPCRERFAESLGEFAHAASRSN